MTDQTANVKEDCHRDMVSDGYWPGIRNGKIKDEGSLTPVEREGNELFSPLESVSKCHEDWQTNAEGIAESGRLRMALSWAIQTGAPGSWRGARDLTIDDLKHLNEVLEHTVADNTRINYRAQWRRFVDWALLRKINPLPGEPAQVAAYLAERLEIDGHKPATLRASAAAISFIHRTAGLDDPCGTEEVRKILSGAARKAGSIQKQAEGLTAEALKAIIETACIPRRSRGGNYETDEGAKRRGEMDIAIISLMRDAMLRVSEAVALRWMDLHMREDGTGRLFIGRSKTDPKGKGAVAFVSAPTMNTLVPIRRDAVESESIFRLQRNQIANRIKQAALAAGLGSGYSGHSPRVGMARDLARAGTELPRLMTAGRWRSPRMPALYTRNETVARGAVAQYYGDLDYVGSPRN